MDPWNVINMYVCKIKSKKMSYLLGKTIKTRNWLPNIIKQIHIIRLLSILKISQRKHGFCFIVVTLYIPLITLLCCEPGSSVSVVYGYGLDDQAIEV
jgi:hypothetical protein